MKYAHLSRTHESDQGTFGRMNFGDGEVFSGELPDRGNAPNISRIPAALYLVKWTYSPAFKRMMYLVTGVPGRSGIRLHSANLMGDRAKGFKSHLYGCVALGRRVGSIKGQRALLVSRPAIRELETWGGGEPFELEIV